MTDTNKVEPVAVTKALFCDMKSDKDKSNFFLSGRGYETGVISSAIQNDVALAYQKCDNYASALAALQAQLAKEIENSEGLERTARAAEMMCNDLMSQLAEAQAETQRYKDTLQDVRAHGTRYCIERDKAQADAARYRALRRGQKWSVINGVGESLRAEALDAAIDASLGEKNHE